MISRHLRKLIRTANEAGIVRNLWLVFRIRSRRPRIWVYPDLHFSFGREVSLSGSGCLHIGRRWTNRRYLQSELVVEDHARVTINGDFSIYTGCAVAIRAGAELVLGSGYINHRASLECYQRIAIGDSVAKGVTIRDSDAHAINGNSRISAPIIIGNRVWIGTNAIVLKGVTIGDGSGVVEEGRSNERCSRRLARRRSTGTCPEIKRHVELKLFSPRDAAGLGACTGVLT